MRLAPDRADLIGNPFLDPNRPRSQVVNQWFNVNAFASQTQAGNSFDGTSGRGNLDGPGLKNVDVGVYRDFRIAEKKTLMFRAEMTNALNLVNLSNPQTSAGNSATIGHITTAEPDAANAARHAGCPGLEGLLPAHREARS